MYTEAVNRLAREGVSINLPEQFRFSYSERPGVIANFYSADNAIHGSLEKFAYDISVDQKRLPAVFKRGALSGRKVISEAWVTLPSSGDRMELYVFEVEPEPDYAGEVYALMLKESMFFVIGLKSPTFVFSELAKNVYTVAANTRLDMILLQRRTVRGSFDIISQGRDWIWYDDVPGGCIFSIAKGERPLCISIRQTDSDRQMYVGREAAEEFRRDLFIGNQIIEAMCTGYRQGPAVHVNIAIVISSRPYTINISSINDIVSSPRELLDLEEIQSFFNYNIAFYP